MQDEEHCDPFAQYFHFTNQSFFFSVSLSTNSDAVGYKIAVDDRAMVGVNHRIISEELERKKEEYQNHEELSQVAKLYESNEVISIPINKPYFYFDL